MPQIPTVLASVAIIFAWVVRYQNGGLLNVVFKPNGYSNGTMTFIEDLNADKLIKYAKQVALGTNEMSLEVLRTMPASLGGGNEGALKALENPNREYVFTTVPIVILVLMIIALLGLFIINLIVCCCGCCCSSSKTRKHRIRKDSSEGSEYHDSKDDSDETIIDSGMTKAVEKLTERSTFLKERQGIVCCCCHIAAVALLLCYSVGMIFSLCFYFSASGELINVLETRNETDAHVQLWLNGEAETVSLDRSLQFGASHIIEFMKKGVSDGEKQTSEVVDTLKSVLMGDLDPGVDTLLNKIETNLKLPEIIDSVTKIETEYSLFSNSTTYVSTQRSAVVTSFQTLQAQFTRIKDEIKSSCTSPPNCDNIKNQADIMLTIGFQPDLLLEIVPAMATEIQNGADVMTQSITEIINAKQSLLRLKQTAITSIGEKIDLNLLLQPLSSLWGRAGAEVDSFVETIEGYTKQITTYTGMASPYVKLALYAPGGLMIVITLALIICTILLIWEAFKRHLFSATGESASLASSRNPRRYKSHVCGSGFFCCVAFLLIVVVLLLAVLSTIMLVISTLLAVEACPYMADETGVAMIDFVVDGVIQRNWKVWTDGLGPPPGSEGADMIASALDIKQPRAVLTAISFTCNSTMLNAGLFQLIGMTQLLNVSAVVESNDIKSGIEQGKTAIITEIKGADLSKKIPLADLQTLIANLNKYVPFLNLYDGDAIALYISNLLQPDYTAFIKMIEDEPQTRGSVVTLKTGVQTAEQLRLTAKKLADAYVGINAGKQMPTQLTASTESIQTLVDNLSVDAKITALVGAPFEESMTQVLGSFGTGGTAVFDRFVDNLLPCGDLHQGFRAMVLTPCGPSGINPRIFAWSLLLTMTILFAFLGFVGVFNLWCIQNHQLRRFVNAGTDSEFDDSE